MRERDSRERANKKQSKMRHPQELKRTEGKELKERGPKALQKQIHEWGLDQREGTVRGVRLQTREVGQDRGAGPPLKNARGW